MKSSLPAVLILAGALFCAAALPDMVPWQELKAFLPDVLGDFRAATAAEGGRWDEEGISLSLASRRYGTGTDGDGLEVSILDTGGTGVALAEFRRLRTDGERSPVRTVTSARVRGFPAVQARYHRESKAEVLVLVADRLLAHVVASDIGGREEWGAARSAALDLDLKGLERLLGKPQPRQGG